MGYSFWVALVSSVFYYFAAALINIDLLRKGYNEDVILQGEPIKGGVLVHMLCGSGKATTPPSSPTRDSVFEEEYTSVYQTPRAKAVIKDRPSSAVFVPLPEGKPGKRDSISSRPGTRDSIGSRPGTRDSIGSRVSLSSRQRMSCSELPQEEPPPPYTPFGENKKVTRVKSKK